MKITILYDNAAQRGFHAGHGFACLVEGKRTILFDTGWDGYLLLANMVRLDITPAQIDGVMLSHSHWDHIGGFHDFDDYPLVRDIPLLVPCHCTRHTRELQKRYPDRCEPGYAGKIIRL